MAKKAKQKKPPAKADVGTYKHEDAKRKNIPTAENQKLVADEEKAIKKLRWKRNPNLDPQLVWRGKDIESDPLEVDAPPIYIQEKIQPRAIIEDLRKQTQDRRKDGAPQFDFFHDFNGLPEGWKADATQSYYHDEGNWQNRMILGDSLLVWEMIGSSFKRAPQQVAPLAGASKSLTASRWIARTDRPHIDGRLDGAVAVHLITPLLVRQRSVRRSPAPCGPPSADMS